ncbi:hypothetical protein [Paenibacillus apiarius]|uniref:hypothetical protein n=1 Tax=Paenibacillus apiarius TaxID=46240 RepID=UPI003B3A46A0
MDEQYVNTIMGMVKELGQFQDDQDARIRLQIRFVTRKVLNYINHLAVPEALYEVVAEMVTQVMMSGGSTVIQGSGAVKKITRGDYSVEYDVGAKEIGGSEAKADILTDYRGQLNRFRRVRTV